MSARDELATWLDRVSSTAFLNGARGRKLYTAQADALIAEGWRKVPSREEIAEALERNDPEGGTVPDEGEPKFSYWYPQADAILALMEADR